MSQVRSSLARSIRSAGSATEPLFSVRKAIMTLLHIKVGTTELLINLAEAINKGIARRKSARAGTLRDELSNLPSAQ